MNMKWTITISVLLSPLVLSPGLGSELSAIVETMGNRHECEQNPSEIHWISEKTSALVIGKSEDSVAVCRLKFGLATIKDGARLRLSFDFIYNHACGVYLQINESTTSDFFSSDTNTEMFKSGCNTKDPGPLYAQPKKFVLISLVKEDESLEAYNFRLNISMADSLPSTGPEFHVVIIVGFVSFTVVILLAIVLFKYVTRMSYHWHEQRVEETMSRAINIYNSQEHVQEADLVYMRPGDGQQSKKRHAGGSEIAFVHSDGRIEKFRPLSATGSDQSNLANREKVAKNLEARLKSHESRNHHVIGHEEPSTSLNHASIDSESVLAPCLGTDFGDTASLGGCDIPPSYEEALGMPLATDVEKSIDNAVGERLDERLDYFNIDVDENRKSVREISIERGGIGNDSGTSS